MDGHRVILVAVLAMALLSWQPVEGIAAGTTMAPSTAAPTTAAPTTAAPTTAAPTTMAPTTAAPTTMAPTTAAPTTAAPTTTAPTTAGPTTAAPTTAAPTTATPTTTTTTEGPTTTAAPTTAAPTTTDSPTTAGPDGCNTALCTSTFNNCSASLNVSATCAQCYGAFVFCVRSVCTDATSEFDTAWSDCREDCDATAAVCGPGALPSGLLSDGSDVSDDRIRFIIGLGVVMPVLLILCVVAIFLTYRRSKMSIDNAGPPVVQGKVHERTRPAKKRKELKAMGELPSSDVGSDTIDIDDLPEIPGADGGSGSASAPAPEETATSGTVASSATSASAPSSASASSSSSSSSS